VGTLNKRALRRRDQDAVGADGVRFEEGVCSPQQANGYGRAS